MKFLTVFAASCLASLASAQGSAQDAQLKFHCQGDYVVPANRDTSLDQLRSWCDANNTLTKGKMAEFSNGNTTAFFCVYGDRKGCTSKELDQFYGGMKAFCPQDGQGGESMLARYDFNEESANQG